MLYTETVEARASTAYVGEDLVPPTGQYWLGWDTPTSSIEANTDVHALFVEPKLPDYIPASYDYIYSDDPSDTSMVSIDELFGILEAGKAKEYLTTLPFSVMKNRTFSQVNP